MIACRYILGAVLVVIFALWLWANWDGEQDDE